MSEKNPMEGSGLVAIGEMLHASIPGPGKAMRELMALGEMAYSEPSEPLDYIKNIISSQARQGADYIDINVDALVINTPTLMRHYVRLVHEWGEGVPPCIDSSNREVLLAGITEWFELGGHTPLLNSIPYLERGHFGAILDLRKNHEFSVIALLMGVEGPLKNADEIWQAARAMAETLKGAGFRMDQIFFDTVTLGIAADSCIDSLGEPKCTHTRNSFMGMQKIKADPALSGAHCVLGVSNWVYGTQKRRLGHIRAYVEVAKKYGLDAAIIDVEKQYGVLPAPQELAEFVEGIVGLKGDEESVMEYRALMQSARENGWI